MRVGFVYEVTEDVSQDKIFSSLLNNIFENSVVSKKNYGAGIKLFILAVISRNSHQNGFGDNFTKLKKDGTFSVGINVEHSKYLSSNIPNAKKMIGKIFMSSKPIFYSKKIKDFDIELFFNDCEKVLIENGFLSL